MTQPERSALTSAALDYDTTIIGALELSEKKWVLAVQLPGVKRHTRHVLGASGEELAQLIERLKARCVATGHPITVPIPRSMSQYLPPYLRSRRSRADSKRGAFP